MVGRPSHKRLAKAIKLREGLLAHKGGRNESAQSFRSALRKRAGKKHAMTCDMGKDGTGAGCEGGYGDVCPRGVLSKGKPTQRKGSRSLVFPVKEAKGLMDPAARSVEEAGGLAGLRFRGGKRGDQKGKPTKNGLFRRAKALMSREGR